MDGRPIRLWINAGELSGDMHGGALLRALRSLRPGLEAVGMGGPNLAVAGMATPLRVESLSVMGGTEVLLALPRAVALLRRIGREFTRRRAEGALDAVVLIDAPAFNFWVARLARRLDIPVYYHIPPKVWAWRTGRVRFLRGHARRVFCILPFEEEFYRNHGMEPGKAVFLGNPLVDLVHPESLPALSENGPENRRIGIMPGSRKAEVQSLMPVFGGAARLLRARRPELEFCCLRAPNMDEGALRALWPEEIPLAMIEPNERYAGMRSCAFLLAASGTATLEAALVGTPAIIAYRLSPITYVLAKRVVRVPFIGLPNLSMGREIFPECIQNDAKAGHIAALAGTWLDDPDRLAAVRADLDRLRELCGPPGSTRRVAEALLQDLDGLRV
jgi:lipid-A-disaccharide synthase